MDSTVIAATTGTAPESETATEEIAQSGSPEVTDASKGAQAESTPPADDELAEFKADVAKASGEEPATKTETESKTEESAAQKSDEHAADEGKEKESDADLSQENETVPEKLTERPEWQKLTAIADKVGKAEGKEARALLRGFYKREYDLNQSIEKAKPAQEVVQEMFQSVGGSEQGFRNMRQLIKSFDVDPAGAVPMLKTLLSDAEKRAGLVLQSPELLTEAQQLDQQVKDGVIDQTAADKRKKELLELEQVRTTQKRTQTQTDAERQRQQRTQSEQKVQAAATEINQAEEAWVNAKQKSDPDFAAVQILYSAFAKQNALDFFHKGSGLPNAKETVEILEKSLKQAKDEAAKFRPKPKARQAIASGSNGSSGNNRQQPSNELDEFKAEVERAQNRHAR